MVHEKNPDVLGGLRGLELLDTLRLDYVSTAYLPSLQ
jgi:hypothetical protein